MQTEPVEMLKSWAKVFVASMIAVYMAGGRDWNDMLAAGVAAVLPLVYTWLDPHDPRFGRWKQ